MPRNDTHCMNCGWRPLTQAEGKHETGYSDAIRCLGARLALNERPQLEEYPVGSPCYEVLAQHGLTESSLSLTV